MVNLKILEISIKVVPSHLPTRRFAAHVAQSTSSQERHSAAETLTGHNSHIANGTSASYTPSSSYLLSRLSNQHPDIYNPPHGPNSTNNQTTLVQQPTTFIHSPLGSNNSALSSSLSGSPGGVMPSAGGVNITIKMDLPFPTEPRTTIHPATIEDEDVLSHMQ